jgi:ATP-dependent DNA ligase
MIGRVARPSFIVHDESWRTPTVKNLADLQAECGDLGIKVATKGRASKEPYIAALRDFHWQKDHPNEPLPAQIMPMLLGSWEDLDEPEVEEIEQDHHAWLVQPKLDGVRALLHIESGRVRITSRTVSEVTYRLSEFQGNIPHLATGLASLEGTILDGELVCPVSSLDTGSTVAATALQATMAILAASLEKARHFQNGQNAHVRYHVFDILRSGGVDTTSLSLVDRQELLEKAIRELNNTHIELVPSYAVNKTEIHRRIIDASGEGTVWKRADGRYEPGRRVRHWIKRKRGIEVEAFVTGFKPGTNGHTGLVGAVEFSVETADARRAAIGWVSSFSNEERLAMTTRDVLERVLLSPSFLGRKAIIAGQDRSAKSDRFRHARILKWC